MVEVSLSTRVHGAVLANEEEKDATTNYLIESKRLGLKVFLPHVNSSGSNIEIQNEGIRLGLTSVKFIKDKTAAAIMQGRPFLSYKDLMEKAGTQGSGMNARAI